MGDSLVAVGYDSSEPEKALSAALEESGVLGAIRRGDSVYLRVNSNSGDPYPYSTSPQVILSVGKRLRDLGVTDIRIGDRSFWGDPNTKGNLERNGIAEAARLLGTTAIVFDDTVRWVTLPASSMSHWIPPVRIPEVVHSATHFINLACVKTHFIAHITMCLKLCLGLVHAEDREREGNLHTHVQGRLWSQIVEISQHIKPTINILDGFEAVITGGPTVRDRPPGAPPNWRPQTARLKTIIASADPIAADVVGAALLRAVSPRFEIVQQLSPFNLPQIQTAMQFGNIGLSNRNQLRLVGSTFPDLNQIRAQLEI